MLSTYALYNSCCYITFVVPDVEDVHYSVSFVSPMYQLRSVLKPIFLLNTANRNVSPGDIPAPRKTIADKKMNLCPLMCNKLNFPQRSSQAPNVQHDEDQNPIPLALS